jgi:transcriptional regulator with PAS, ATPase and Fis domain
LGFPLEDSCWKIGQGDKNGIGSISTPRGSRRKWETFRSFDEEDIDVCEQVLSTSIFEEIVGPEAICSVTAQVRRVAPSGATVLITGESGTGFDY